MKHLLSFLRIIGKILVGLTLSVIVYFIAAFTLTYIPINSDFKPAESDSVEIYLRSNGVHTDLVVPIKNEIKDWSLLVPPSNARSGNANVKFVSFGWGDKGFYIETPTWGDLRFKTAFKALFWLGSAAMHVVFYSGMAEDDRCKKVCIAKETYKKLARYITNSFQLSNNRSVLISGANYADNDAFYEAKGRYSLFFTCNTWTNCGLKAADMKACLWTPFDKGILYHYKNNLK